MGSFHDSMAAHFGAPMLFDHFAERDANGEKKPIGYTPPGSASSLLWPAVVSRIKVEFVADPDSQAVMRMETRTITVNREDIERDGVFGFQRKAIVTIDGEPWNTREDESSFGATLVTIGLQRQPLTGLGEQREV